MTIYSQTLTIVRGSSLLLSGGRPLYATMFFAFFFLMALFSLYCAYTGRYVYMASIASDGAVVINTRRTFLDMSEQRLVSRIAALRVHTDIETCGKGSIHCRELIITLTDGSEIKSSLPKEHFENDISVSIAAKCGVKIKQTEEKACFHSD